MLGRSPIKLGQRLDMTRLYVFKIKMADSISVKTVFKTSLVAILGTIFDAQLKMQLRVFEYGYQP